jgi:hypothetical protein
MRGYHPQAEIIEEGVFAITCDFHGQSRTMTALRKSLSDELQSRDQMLNARERTVIENHLIGEVANGTSRTYSLRGGLGARRQ